MGKSSKEEFRKIISYIEKRITRPASVFFIGGASCIIGFDVVKYTNDADTYNKVSSEFCELWEEAANALGIDIELSKSSVFTPPDGFEDRMEESDLSGAKVKVYFMERHDLVISKLARSSPKDAADIKLIHNNAPINLNTLINRFENEYINVSSIGSKREQQLNLIDVVDSLFGKKDGDILRLKYGFKP